MLYRKVLRKTLQEVFEECLVGTPAEQVALYEELALMRTTALDVVRLYDAAHETGKPELIAGCGSALRAVLSEIADMCHKIAAIEASGKDKITVSHITYVVNQVVRVAYDVFQEHPVLASKFEQLVRSEVTLPSAQGGTLITPDQDVLAMDDTVPMESEDET